MKYVKLFLLTIFVALSSTSVLANDQWETTHNTIKPVAFEEDNITYVVIQETPERIFVYFRETEELQFFPFHSALFNSDFDTLVQYCGKPGECTDTMPRYYLTLLKKRYRIVP